MRARLVIGAISKLNFFIGLTMLAPLILAWADGGRDAKAISTSMLITLLISGIIAAACRGEKQDISHKEGMLIVAAGWLSVGIFGALPYFIGQVLGEMSVKNFIDCLFESISGFTTTGSSVFGATVAIESLGRGILLWRALTQWLGGMGIIVIAVAILPMLGVGGMQLFRAEASGHLHEKLRPRIRETAMALWVVYIVITAAQVALLKLGGINLFDAICHSFTTISTGGFSTKDSSIAFFNSAYVDTVTIIFMFIGATSFSLHYKAWTKGIGAYLKDSQFGYFLLMFTLGSLFVVACLKISGSYATFQEALRYGFFQAASLITCTGFATSDYNYWPAAAQVALLLFMLMGGCAGSTAGAIKTIKVVLLFKYAKREVLRLMHPSIFAAIKFNKKVVGRNVLESVTTFFIFYVLIFSVATILLTIGGMRLDEAAFSTASAMGNVGPGIGSTGAIGNYYSASVFSKFVLMACMVLGRLEIFTVIVLMTREFWKK